jgi:hypothetical protein
VGGVTERARVDCGRKGTESTESRRWVWRGCVSVRKSVMQSDSRRQISARERCPEHDRHRSEMQRDCRPRPIVWACRMEGGRTDREPRSKRHTDRTNLLGLDPRRRHNNVQDQARPCFDIVDQSKYILTSSLYMLSRLVSNHHLPDVVTWTICYSTCPLHFPSPVAWTRGSLVLSLHRSSLRLMDGSCLHLQPCHYCPTWSNSHIILHVKSSGDLLGLQRHNARVFHAGFRLCRPTNISITYILDRP